MKFGLLLGSAAALLVGVGVACSTFSATDPAPTEAEGGTDTGAPATKDGATDDGATDAALPPTPGSVDCFGTACSAVKQNACCFDPDAGSTSCVASPCAFGTLTLGCDDRSDCAPAQVCCIGFFGNTDCQKTCDGTGERLCHTDSECEKGSSCVLVPCRGTTIGTCGPVGNYVKSFCNVP
jgi:hypothetical protein